MTADGRYRSAVNEMLLVKENAWAVPLLNEPDFEEWINKNGKVRQASRMVQKEQNNALDALKPGSGARQKLALELCRKAGLVVEYLEERNEMSETPLIREAGDGRARNVLLLLERVPTLTQSKRMSWPSLP
jgi:NADH dehydrogenase/NADH:ubiquinone oxidoreductase subunit G